MINFEALYKISYGLYIVCSGDKDYGNGFISNTIFQVTSDPAQFAACCNKNNYSSEIIEKYGSFSVSVLQEKTDSKLIGSFGYKSGKDFNKMEGMNLKYGETGVPIVLDNTLAYLECRVVQRIDMGTHWMFIGELLDAQLTEEISDPITYAYYRKVMKGVAPKNAPTYIDKSKFASRQELPAADKYKCVICGHIYDDAEEEVKFADLPDAWTCPVCGADKEDFIKV